MPLQYVLRKRAIVSPQDFQECIIWAVAGTGHFLTSRALEQREQVLVALKRACVNQAMK